MPISDFTRVLKSLMILLFVSVLNACGEDYIPLGEYRIEPDPYDPKLHGIVVRFNRPMIYEVLNQSDRDKYAQEILELGRVLSPRSYKNKKINSNPARFEEIPTNMAFKIKSSYWYRVDWLNKSLNDDLRKIILVDENGVESDSLFSVLEDADQPNLNKFRDEGK